MPEAFERVRHDMLTSQPPGTCRGLAAALAIDKMTVWRWRRRIIGTLEDSVSRSRRHAAMGGYGTADAVLLPVAVRRLRESRKGARLWVAHRRDPLTAPAPHRPRWIDVDRKGEALPAPLWTFQNIVALGSDASGLCRPSVLPAGPPVAASAPAAGTAQEVEFPLRAAFDAFLRPFRGPAAAYLGGYAVWFATRLDSAGGDWSSAIDRQLASRAGTPATDA